MAIILPHPSLFRSPDAAACFEASTGLTVMLDGTIAKQKQSATIQPPTHWGRRAAHVSAQPDSGNAA